MNTPTLQQICITLPTAKRLRELGVTAPAYAMHWKNRRDNYELVPFYAPGYSISGAELDDWNYWAYTADELLPMLGSKYAATNILMDYCNAVISGLKVYNFADYLGDCIIWRIEERVLLASDCNSRALKPPTP
jgi:hypothetical protein